MACWEEGEQASTYNAEFFNIFWADLILHKLFRATVVDEVLLRKLTSTAYDCYTSEMLEKLLCSVEKSFAEGVLGTPSPCSALERLVLSFVRKLKSIKVYKKEVPDSLRHRVAAFVRQCYATVTGSSQEVPAEVQEFLEAVPPPRTYREAKKVRSRGTTSAKIKKKKPRSAANELVGQSSGIADGDPPTAQLAPIRVKTMPVAKTSKKEKKARKAEVGHHLMDATSREDVPNLPRVRSPLMHRKSRGQCTMDTGDSL